MLRHVCFGIVTLVCVSASLGQKVELTNNQPFDIRMPLRVRELKLDGQPSILAQPDGKDTVIFVEAPANQVRTLSFVAANPTPVPQADADLNVTVDESGAISLGGKPMGALSWSIVHEKAKAAEKSEDAAPKGKTAAKSVPPPSTKRDFAAGFKALPMKFTRAASGPFFEMWTASATDSGMKLDVTLTAYRTGFLDVTAVVTNQSDQPQMKVYAAVVTRWQQPKVASRSLCYDNRRSDFADGKYSTFREGEGKQLYIQRGVDWINSKFDDGAALWMNDFSPSFTVHRDKTEKLGPRWVGANTAQLAQEAQTKDGAIYSICEIARPNLKQYASRLSENILPGKDQPLTFTSRVTFDKSAANDDVADQRFVGYVGFNSQEITTVGARVKFGVPFTRMGTNYFPYSTLGENFGHLRMAGMSKEGYWPLAPMAVNKWQLFADDIRRDLATIKALGFDLVRLHHLELIYDKDKKGQPYVSEEKRWEYLDFLFKEIERLQLKALLDVKLTPEQCAELVKRYRPLVDGVEYDNEVLIFQIFDEDPPVWKAVRDAVKKVAPEITFHLTAHTNAGAFDRVTKLGAESDRIGEHTYMDGLDPIPSSRDYSLAMANYAAKHGKEPIITEWNWRFLTRMPMDERAKVYAPIFENVLAARCMPVMYQFQYQDSLAMNPATLKGMRRYEELLLSRRPKPEAFVMAGLIEKYGPPDSAVRKIGCEHAVTEITGDGGKVEFSLENKTDQPIPVVLSVEGPAELKLSLESRRETVLRPKSKTSVQVSVTFADASKALPGFYHVFLRIHAADDSLRYGWAEVRRPGNVKFDASENAGIPGVKVEYGSGTTDYDFNRPLVVVYPDEATPMELESAWTMFITLESATGRPVDIYQMSDFKKLDRAGNVVLVTREKDAKPSVRLDGGKLVIAAGDERGVMDTAMDFVVRYWKNAKDAGARKVGLVEGTAVEAGGKTDLDQ
jgi:hypothetical protein